MYALIIANKITKSSKIKQDKNDIDKHHCILMLFSESAIQKKLTRWFVKVVSAGAIVDYIFYRTIKSIIIYKDYLVSFNR